MAFPSFSLKTDVRMKSTVASLGPVTNSYGKSVLVQSQFFTSKSAYLRQYLTKVMFWRQWVLACQHTRNLTSTDINVQIFRTFFRRLFPGFQIVYLLNWIRKLLIIPQVYPQLSDISLFHVGSISASSVVSFPSELTFFGLLNLVFSRVKNATQIPWN